MTDINVIGTQLCDFCITAMKYGCSVLGISYGLLNVLLFVIIEPLCILLFAIAAIMYMKFRKSDSKVKRVIAHSIFAMGVLFVLIEIAIILPCIYGALNQVGCDGSSVIAIMNN